MTPATQTILFLILAVVSLAAATLVSHLRSSPRSVLRRVRSEASLTLLGMLVASGTVFACSGMSPGTAQTLSGVVSRVDVGKVVECADAGIAKEVAKCLGARLLTEGLEEAITQATSAANDALAAVNPGAGAADMTEDDRTELASDLDKALDNLGNEIARANALAEQ